jgi:hypothetical protein
MEAFELCPEAHEGDNPSNDALERYAKLRVRIATQVQAMADAEQRMGYAVGIRRLLGNEPPVPVRLAATLLLAKSLTDALRSVDSVGDLCDYSVGTTSPTDSLTVRQAFARDGVLRAHTVFGMGRTLDRCCRVSLTEKALCVALALPPEQAMEFDVFGETRGWRE